MDLIFQETRVTVLHVCGWSYGSIFSQIFTVSSKRRVFASIECVSAVQGHSRSMILVPIESAYMICDFLLVISSNSGPTLHRFWDTATYISWKLRAFFLPVSHSAPSLPMFPSEFCGEVNNEEIRVMGYLWSKLHDPNFNRFGLVDPMWRTDGQSDGRVIAYSALSVMLSRATSDITTSEDDW